MVAKGTKLLPPRKNKVYIPTLSAPPDRRIQPGNRSARARSTGETLVPMTVLVHLAASDPYDWGVVQPTQAAKLLFPRNRTFLKMAAASEEVK